MVVAWVYKDFEELAKCKSLVKQDPGRARQNDEGRAGVSLYQLTCASPVWPMGSILCSTEWVTGTAAWDTSAGSGSETS